MHASAPSPRHHSSRRKAVWIIVAVFVAAAIGLPTIALGRLQGRILALLTRELGRRVTAQSVHLTLLPWPGVELDQVRLADMPGFGGEALATALQARATLRIWALLGGRLEFSSIHLDQANINLARNQDGRWNLSELLSNVHRAGPHLRPTAARGAWRRAGRFPYLAIQDSRINFKFELKKEPFYLSGVNGSLALASQGWRFHLQFTPQRSDLNLSDTGIVTADGIWYRPAGQGHRPRHGAPEPLHFDLAAHLRGAYLAGATALLFGQDAGVHGVARADLQIQGTNRQFRVSGVLQARQLRRWDQLPSGLRLRVPFAVTYDSATDVLSLTRLGGDQLDLQGQITSLLSHPVADLTLRVRQLPTAALLPLARAFDPALPADLEAQGKWTGSFAISNRAAGRWSAQGEAAAAQTSLREGELRLRLSAPSCRNDGAHRIVCSSREARVTGPDHADAGLSLRAMLDRRGVLWQFSGDRVTVADVAALGQLFGVAAPWPYQLAGAARLQLRRNLSWASVRGYAPPAGWTGQAVWRRAALRLPALHAPLPIRNLQLQLGPARSVRLRGQAMFGGTLWQLVVARPAPDTPWSFVLAARRMSVAKLSAALRPQPPQGFLARLFSHPASWLPLLQLVHARGEIEIGAVRWRQHQAALRAQVAADGAVWRFPSVLLRLAGGAVEGHADLQRGVFDFIGRGQHLDLAYLLAHTAYAQALRGDGRVRIQITMPVSAGAMTASGWLTVQPGAFPLLLSPSGRPLGFYRYRTRFDWNHGVFDLADGRLWPAASAAPMRVTVQLQPPSPPRLEWAPTHRRTALTGAWPASAASLQPQGFHHERR